MAVKIQLHGRTTKKLNVKLQGKDIPAYTLLEVVCFKKKLLFVEDTEGDELLNFKNLKQYPNETNAITDTDYFSITLKHYLSNSKQTKVLSRSNPLNTKTIEINIESFGTNAGSLQMQLLDLKIKDLEWQVHRTQHQVGRVGGPEMQAHRAA
ncbi:hypothetical protein HNY73_014243 [Argiope bruennichi]|uniref:Uncharacterized protein n=1 Tax=Argiope bruennichi TaxID=94029 RepID=A0A8T0ESN8_ARGBR|nr:hypothetical protein HNY73_014243 [Argiope bruennichi]